MNPVFAGVIAGLMLPWFPNFLMLSILGVLALVYYGWRKSLNAARTWSASRSRPG